MMPKKQDIKFNFINDNYKNTLQNSISWRWFLVQQSTKGCQPSNSNERTNTDLNSWTTTVNVFLYFLNKQDFRSYIINQGMPTSLGKNCELLTSRQTGLAQVVLKMNKKCNMQRCSLFLSRQFTKSSIRIMQPCWVIFCSQTPQFCLLTFL